MVVIAVAALKGGVGKSTTAQVQVGHDDDTGLIRQGHRPSGEEGGFQTGGGVEQIASQGWERRVELFLCRPPPPGDNTVECETKGLLRVFAPCCGSTRIVFGPGTTGRGPSRRMRRHGSDRPTLIVEGILRATVGDLQ